MSKPEDTTKGMNAVLLEQARANGIPIAGMVESGSIEASEAEGQKQLVQSTSLPARFNGGDRARARELLIKWGFELGDPMVEDQSSRTRTPLFMEAKLPPGWKKEPTDHSMWSKVVDEKGRERLSIFYKAAFYDREAFMNVMPRYQNIFSSKDPELTGEIEGCEVFRFEFADYEKDQEPSTFKAIDMQAGEVLAVFTGGYGGARDAAVAFMTARFGANYSSPEHWTE